MIHSVKSQSQVTLIASSSFFFTHTHTLRYTSMRNTFVVLTGLLLAISTLVAAQSSVTVRTHSISMPYIGMLSLLHLWKSLMLQAIDDELQNRWFDFGGDTVINTNRHIRLTSRRLQGQQGYLWSRLVTWELLSSSAFYSSCLHASIAFDIIQLWDWIRVPYWWTIWSSFWWWSCK